MFIGQKNVRDSTPASAEPPRARRGSSAILVRDLDRVHPVHVARPVELDGRPDPRHIRKERGVRVCDTPLLLDDLLDPAELDAAHRRLVARHAEVEPRLLVEEARLA